MNETCTVIGTGVAIIVVNFGLFAWLRSDIKALDDRVRNHGERLAKLEGLLEGLREAISGRRAA